MVISESQIVLPALERKQMPTTSLCESQLMKQDWPYSPLCPCSLSKSMEHSGCSNLFFR